MINTGKHFEVQPPLAEIVKHFYCIQTDGDYTEIIGHLSPNFEMMMIFNFGAPVRISFAGNPLGNLQVEQVGVLGPLRKMLNFEVLKNTDLVAVIFNLDGFYRLFHTPMDTLDDESIHDPDVLINKSCCTDLWEMLNKMPSLEDRIRFISDYIHSFMEEPELGSKPLMDGLTYFNDPSIQPVKAIAADSNLSERTIQTRFKKYVGYSPKELLRFLRFKQVITTIEQAPGETVDWFDLIHDFGYHDQSHLIKDFKHFLGTTPQEFIRKFAGKEFCTTKPGKFYS